MAGKLFYFDAHCHLQDERFSVGIEQVLRRARQAGVESVMCCGSAPADWPGVAACARQPTVLVSFGVHPWYAHDLPAGWQQTLSGFLAQTPSGVGEIGLDFAFRRADRELQTKIFLEQLRIAAELRRPVSIHCRRAWAALVEALKRVPLPAGGMIHAWSGSADMVSELEKLGMYISFAASITRENNRRGVQSAQRVSLDRLLIETDSPDMPPPASNGALNEPAFIHFVAETIAAVRQDSISHVASASVTNARRLFAACR